MHQKMHRQAPHCFEEVPSPYHLAVTPALWDMAAPSEPRLSSNHLHAITLRPPIVLTFPKIHLCRPSRSDCRTIPRQSRREIYFTD